MAHIIDLRSDTLTKPTEAMKHAIVNSPLNDDVYDVDPTVRTLETKLAALLEKQAALFVPSGTMANLIAIMVHCKKRGSQVFAGNKSQMYKKGGATLVADVLLSSLENKPDGTFDIDELEDQITGTDIHEPITSLVAVENTHNVCGGKVLGLQFLDDLAALCKKYSLPLHMDGARLFNAAEYSKESPARIVRDCDSVSICFSKGLSAPVGSVLVGTSHFIAQARRMRKMLGGAMRQVGVLAGAALVALDEVVPMLGLDHKRAQRLAEVIDGMFLKTFSVDVKNVQTNIVLLKIAEESPITADQLLQRLEQVSLAEIQGDCKTPDDKGMIVKAVSLDNKTIRFMLYREIDDEALSLAIMKINYVLKELDGTK